MTKTPTLPSNVIPRGFNIRQAAEYWGYSVGTLKKLVELGVAPGPINLAGLDRNIYDRLALDTARARAGDERKSA